MANPCNNSTRSNNWISLVDEFFEGTPQQASMNDIIFFFCIVEATAMLRIDPTINVEFILVSF